MNVFVWCWDNTQQKTKSFYQFILKGSNEILIIKGKLWNTTLKEMTTPKISIKRKHVRSSGLFLKKDVM